MLNKWRTWGISLGIALTALMIEAYMDMNLHKILAMLFLVLFIVHVASSRRKNNPKGKGTIYMVLMVIVLTGALNIVFKVRHNVTGQAISLLIHELGAWGMVILSLLHSVNHLKAWQRG